MIDTFFEKTYNEEFNKIPAAFRFTKRLRTIFYGLILLWIAIDIPLCGPAIHGSGTTQIMDGRGVPIRTDFSSWTVFIIANLILVFILSWGVIGTAFERMAFKRASRLDRLHKDWVHDKVRNNVLNIRTGCWNQDSDLTDNTSCSAIRYCPRCGLPLEDGEDLCELCKAELK